MSYDAGDVEAELTLDRTPFTEGLRLARQQAERFEKQRIEAKVRVTIEGRRDVTALITRLNNLNRRVIRPRVVLDGVQRVLGQITTINRRLTALGRRVARPRVVINTSGVAAANAAINRAARNRTTTINTRANTRNLGAFRNVLLSLTDTGKELGEVLVKALGASGLVGAKAMNMIGKGGHLAAAAIIGLAAKVGLLTVRIGFAITRIFMMAGAVTFLVGAISTLVGTLPNLITLLGAPIGAIALGWDGIKKAAETLQPEIDKLKESLSELLYNVTLPGFNNLKRLLPVVSVGFHNIAREAGEFFVHMTEVATTERNMRRLEAALAGVLDFWHRMETPIEEVYESMLAVASTRRLYDLLGQTIGSTLYQISRFFDRLLETGKLVKGMEKLRDIIIRLVGTLLDLGEHATDFFLAASDSVIAFFGHIREGMNKINWDMLGDAFGEIAEALGELFAAIPRQVWTDLAMSLRDFAEVLRDPEFIEGFIIIIGFMDEMVDSFSNFVEFIGRAVYWVDRFNTKFQEFDDATQESFLGFLGEIRTRWDNMWEEMTHSGDQNSSAIRQIWDTFLSDLGDSYTSFKDWLGGIWDATWNGIRATAISSIELVWERITGVLDSIGDAFAYAIDIIEAEWFKLKLIAKSPVDFFVNVVYNQGIVPVWNSVAGAFGMSKLNRVNFDQGGVVPGYGPGIDDTPAMLSRGEGILVPEAVRGLGPEFVYWANKHFSNGRARSSGSDEHYAEGGIVGGIADMWNKISGVFTDPAGTIRRLFSRVLGAANDIPGSGLFSQGLRNAPRKIIDAIIGRIKSWVADIGSGIGGMSGPGGWQWQMGVLRSVFAGLPLISGFRPGSITATGNRSYHALGRAVDVPPRMDVFNFIRGAFGGNTKELIFSPAGRHQIWNGRPHYYSEPTRGDHWDHIHWAYDTGGVLPPGVTLAQNNTGQNEYVFTGDLVQELMSVLKQIAEMLSGGGSQPQVVVNASTSNATVQQLLSSITFALRHTSKSVRGH